MVHQEFLTHHNYVHAPFVKGGLQSFLLEVWIVLAPVLNSRDDAEADDLVAHLLEVLV